MLEIARSISFKKGTLNVAFTSRHDIYNSIWQSIIYLLTPWSTVLLEKLTGSQLVKKLLAFYGSRKFSTAFTSTRHLSLSWARSIQSMPLHPTSWRFILILSSHLCLPNGPFPQIFPLITCMHLSSPPNVLHARPSHSTSFYHPNSIRCVDIIKLVIM